MVLGMTPVLNPAAFTPFQVLPMGSPPVSPSQGYQMAPQHLMGPILSSPTSPMTPQTMSSMSYWEATSPGTSLSLTPVQHPMMVPLGEDKRMTMVMKLDKYVPTATNPHETLEEKNFRHALPPRLLHKHKLYVESLIGPETELVINVPPGLVELSRKRLSRGDSRYKGLAEMNIEAKVVGQFDPVVVHAVLDQLFLGNKRTVKSSRRRCFEVINSVKNLTESTGAFVISRPADECVDIYGPEHVVESAIEYLMSMQSQSGVSKRVIHVSPAAASAVIKARRSILPREQGSLFVEPLPKGEPNGIQTVTIYAYVDAGHLDAAEAAIRRIELDLQRPMGMGMGMGLQQQQQQQQQHPMMRQTHMGMPPPHTAMYAPQQNHMHHQQVSVNPNQVNIQQAGMMFGMDMHKDIDEDSLCDHMDPCIDVMQLVENSNSISHSPPPLLEELTEDEVKRRGSLASPKALLAALKMGGALDSPKGVKAATLRSIDDSHASAQNDSAQSAVSSQGLSPMISDSVASPPDTPILLPASKDPVNIVSNPSKYVAPGGAKKPRMIKVPRAEYPQNAGDLTPGKTCAGNIIGA